MNMLKLKKTIFKLIYKNRIEILSNLEVKKELTITP